MKNSEDQKLEDGQETNDITFEDAFEQTGHGRFNHLVLFTSGLIMLNVSMESVGMSYVLTSAQCELELSEQHKGIINAAAFIGIVSTSFLWGYLGDRVGRRAVMLPAMIASALFSVASAFASDVWTLFVLRILTGCFVSASSATVYAYLGEMHANSRRAAAIAWGSVFISFSFIILPGLAWVIIPGKWSFHLLSIRITSWRAFMWSWCVPGLAAAGILSLLPESPRFILASKGPEAALPVLAKMYSWNHGTSADNYPVEKITTIGDSEAFKGGFAGALKNFTHIFRPPLLRCVFISHISMFAVFMLASGLYVWVPEVINNILQNDSERSISICEIITRKAINKTQALASHVEAVCNPNISVGVFPISMAMGAVFAITYLAIGVFINKVGKKALYNGIMFICGLATIAAAYVPQGGAATGLLIIALCAGCAASILAAIAVDVFPTSLRAMAMCVMYMVGRLGAAMGAFFLGATLHTHCELAFTAIGAFSAGSTLLMLFWPNPQVVRDEMEEKGLSY
ncbi:synaptic vesicle glycoprotein 2A-like isoform X1 [Leguminivora glycinivorella]|uniref:synaptic vesicle glycoprotein 2A-like isoform X1 n=1 Tax=Leguminivora glycinivorella TaxID=1035111 RepID=UPI00200C8A10|nr:synaptic vesicle glycoprotein 2A-like isoform X1 [Leguminivora glycinivorella]